MTPLMTTERAVLAAAERDVGPVILDSANSPLFAAVRALRVAEGRHVRTWDWFYANPIVDRDPGDES